MHTLSKLSIRYHHSFVGRPVDAALHLLTPLVLVGAWAQGLLLSVFSQHGFFAEIYGLPRLIPGFEGIHQALELLVTCTIGLLGLLAAAAVAKSVRDDAQAAILAGLSYLILTSAAGRNPLAPTILLSTLFTGVVWGLLIGWLMKGKARLLITALAFGATTALHVGVNAATNAGVWTKAATWWHSFGDRYPLAAVPLNSVLAWLGLPTAQSGQNASLLSANLNAALTKKTIPHPYTLATLYQPFALAGGVGMVLALLIVLWLRRYKRRLAGLALFPVLVNIGSPMVVGVPLMLEPLLLIPSILAPCAASALAALAIFLHVMPPAVYHVPDTTPAGLFAWLATNGNWPALIVALLCLGLAVAIYWPFVGALKEVQRDA